MKKTYLLLLAALFAVASFAHASATSETSLIIKRPPFNEDGPGERRNQKPAPYNGDGPSIPGPVRGGN